MYSVPGLIPGTRDYGISENPLFKILPFIGMWPDNPRITQPDTRLDSSQMPKNLIRGSFGQVLGQTNTAPQSTATAPIATPAPWTNASMDNQSHADSELDALRKIENPNPVQKKRIEELSGTPSLDFGAILNRQKDMLNSLYNQSKGQYDTGMKTLGQKRQQFTDIFNKGKEDIVQGFQKGAGELQKTAAGQSERNANALRALGLGGSAVERTLGRQTQNNAKALGNLQDIRGNNEFQNQQAYNENNQWADTQEGSLNNFLQNADIQRQSGQNNIVDNLSSLFQNIINSQMAYNASIGEKTASPFTVNMPDMMNSITGALGDYGVMNGRNANNMGVSINPNMTQEELLAEQRRKRLYG